MKENIHPKYVETKSPAAAATRFVTRSTQAGTEGRYLQRLPPVLQGQAEVCGHGGPDREVSEEVCRHGLRQPQSRQEGGGPARLPRQPANARHAQSARRKTQPLRGAGKAIARSGRAGSIRARMSAVAREHGSLAKLATKYRRFKDLNSRSASPWKWSRATTPRCASWPRPSCPSLKAEREALWNELLGHDHRRRGRQPHPLRDGNPRRHRRRRGRPVRPRLVRNVQALRRGQALEGGSARHDATELGGFKEIILGLEGEGVYRKLQFESGGHRVQRVPETEAKGRIHTSAATVAVMAEPEDVEIDLKPDDYRKDIFHASGPGGQHVNKTASAIRLTHYETSIVVSCQDEKSQHKNLAKALRVLKTRLYEAKRQEEHAKRADERKTQDRLGRSQPADPHLQFSRKPPHRSPHQPHALQARQHHGGQSQAGDRRPDGIRAARAAGGVRNGRLACNAGKLRGLAGVLARRVRLGICPIFAACKHAG